MGYIIYNEKTKKFQRNDRDWKLWISDNLDNARWENQYWIDWVLIRINKKTNLNQYQDWIEVLKIVKKR